MIIYQIQEILVILVQNYKKDKMVAYLNLIEYYNQVFLLKVEIKEKNEVKLVTMGL
jgi:hypothetical protein